MENTLSKPEWNDVLTIENEMMENFSNQYDMHFQQILTRKDLSEEGNFWFNTYPMEPIFENYFQNLIQYRIPSNKKEFSNLGNYARSFTKLKGFIIDINQEYFTANIFDPKNPGTHEIGEFDLEDVDKDDLELLDKGAIFYWTFGHFVRNGQVIKMSEIRFQRIPQLTTEEADEIYDKSQRLNESLNWD